MLAADKPPLEEVYLEHFGIRGMRWGHRKPVEEGQPRQSLTVNQKRAVKAVAIAGGIAVTAILLKKGNVKVIDAKSSKIYASGIKATARILFKTGKAVVKTSAKLSTTVGKASAKGAVKIGTLIGKGTAKGVVSGSKATVRATTQNGAKFYNNVLKRSAISTVRLGSHAMYKFTGRGKPIVDKTVKKSISRFNPVDLLLNTRADTFRGDKK